MRLVLKIKWSMTMTMQMKIHCVNIKKRIFHLKYQYHPENDVIVGIHCNESSMDIHIHIWVVPATPVNSIVSHSIVLVWVL